MEVLLKLGCYYIRETHLEVHRGFFEYSAEMHLAEKYQSNQSQSLRLD